MSLKVAREARGMLGANGITTEYPVIRHMNNLESVYTYEGTNEIQRIVIARNLIKGVKDLEHLAAFIPLPGTEG